VSIEEKADRFVDGVIGAAKALARREVRDSQESKSTATFQGRDSEGKPYVLLPGSDEAMPVSQMAVDAKSGDSVRVSFKDGRAVVEANLSNPAAGISTVELAQETAEDATRKAGSAAGAAANAQASADSAGIAAGMAQESANRAIADAQSAQQSAASAAASAEAAQESAETAAEMAESAAEDAASANESARAALYGLSDVEKVVGTLNWISQHGSYLLTTDTEVVEGHVYYTLSGGEYALTADTAINPYKQYYEYDSETEEYAPVATPDVADIGSYYERTGMTATVVTDPTDEGLPSYFQLYVDESVQNYLASHLAQTDYGLDIMFDNASDKVHIGTVDGTYAAGVYIVSSGTVKSAYTSDGVTVGPANGFHVSITATELGFFQGPLKVAYVSNNELYIPRTVVLNSMRLGKWSFIQRDSGNMGVFYTGEVSND